MMDSKNDEQWVRRNSVFGHDQKWKSWWQIKSSNKLLECKTHLSNWKGWGEKYPFSGWTPLHPWIRLVADFLLPSALDLTKNKITDWKQLQTLLSLSKFLNSKLTLSSSLEGGGDSRLKRVDLLVVRVAGGISVICFWKFNNKKDRLRTVDKVWRELLYWV